MIAPRPRARRLRVSLRALALAMLPALAGCDLLGPGGDHIVAGVNLTRLYAPPTAAEVRAVLEEWGARDPEAVDARIVAETTVDGARVVIVRHTMMDLDGSPFFHYGTVRIPVGASEAPVLVYLNGGDGGFDLGDELDVLARYPTVFSEAVQVIPVYRSEAIRTASVAGLGPTYRAGGAESPWDYDVDDALALTEAALQLFDAETDAMRIGALGFSRGAGVALLMAARDGRTKVVTEISGPTNLFEPSSQSRTATLLEGDEDALRAVGARYTLEHVLRPLAPDGRYDPDADYAKARLEVVRRSPALFTSRLPALQVHHHRLDDVVPYEHAVALDARRQAAPNRGAYDYNLYGDPPPPGAERPRGYHGMAAMPGGYERADTFLADHLLTLSFTGSDPF